MAVPSYVLGLLLVLTGLVGYFKQTPHVTVVPTGEEESIQTLTLHAEGIAPAEFQTPRWIESASDHAKALKDNVILQGNMGGSMGWYAVVKGDKKKPELRIFHPNGKKVTAQDWSKAGLKNTSGEAISGDLQMGKSPTALIPAIFGLLFIGCAFGSQKMPSLRKHLMHVAAVFALLGATVPAKMAWSSYTENDAISNDLKKELEGVQGVTGVRPSPVKFLSQGVTALLCFFFLVLAIQSFIKARKQAAVTTANGPPSTQRKSLRKPLDEKGAKTAKLDDSAKERDVKEKDSEKDEEESKDSSDEGKSKDEPVPNKGKPMLRASGGKKPGNVKLGSKAPMIAKSDKQKTSKLPSKPGTDDKSEKTKDGEKPTADSSKASEDKSGDDKEPVDDKTKDKGDGQDEATDSKDKEQDSTSDDSKDIPSDKEANDGEKPAADAPKPPEDKGSSSEKPESEQEPKGEPEDKKGLGPMPPTPGSIGTPTAPPSLTKPSSDTAKPPEEKDSSSDKSDEKEPSKEGSSPKKDLGPMPPPSGSSPDPSQAKPSSSPEPSEDKESGEAPSNQTPKFRVRSENKPIRINRPKPADSSSGKEEN